MTERGRPPLSLAGRVLRAVLLILLAGGVMVAAATWFNGRQAARQAYDRILLGAASDIAESITIQDGAPMVDLPVSAFQLLAQAPDDRILYNVIGPGGTFITGFDQLPDTAKPTEGTGVLPVFYDALLQDEPARFIQIKRRFAERDYSGDVAITVGQTLRARKAMALSLMFDALVPALLSGLLLLVMAWFVTRSALRPLEALSDGLALRDPNDLTPMPTDGLPRELQLMLGAMNRFMGRLDRQIAAMRNLISDTAHQLRTPVAAIRAQAEAVVEQPEQSLQRRELDRLLARSRSLGTLLDQLLSRALVIHRTDSAPRLPLDLREVALDIVERRDHELLSPGAELQLVIGEQPVMVQADSFSVTEAAKNLLSNALKHGQSPVQIGAEQHGAHAMLWVQDAGPGPAPHLVQRLGGRFERSATSPEDSAGLGLSIVKAVASALGGQLDLEHRDDGFRIQMVLPAATDDEGT
ncbi:sensor histidine kinase [Paracoccus tegillarcae]|uniref:histidine kinase n=1 Tax=Paracoccus tegillarcae TaxID=1529068 RepID=A0A2K9EKX2_9RHOB|nr:sensor histidine kinase [Paracoccus tegillarcae]AUH32235.1 sensor histidine kinase [Paracoccus tegillarcae]